MSFPRRRSTATFTCSIPARFPYAADTHYRPAGQEMGTAAQLLQVMDVYGTRYALIVGPNSGYGLDNRCLIDAIARSGGRCKGSPSSPTMRDARRSRSAQGRGNRGRGVERHPLRRRLLCGRGGVARRTPRRSISSCEVQVEHDQLVPLLPMLERSGVRILIDHCGRPTPAAGLRPARLPRSCSGSPRRGAPSSSSPAWSKFSRELFPHHDARPYIDALLDAFTPDACMWASD